MGANVVWPSSVLQAGAELTSADSTTAKDLIPTLAADARIDMLAISSDDTANRDVQFILNDGTSDFAAWTVLVLAGSGMSSGVPSTNGINRTACPWINEDGAFFMKSGWKLKIKAVVAVTAAKAIRAVAFGGSLA